jgi:ribonuclease Z
MAFNLTILGSNSSIPTASRFPTSQLVEFNSSYYLLDCGEGTQIQLRKYRIKIQRIRAIFITHLHGDHYFGLFGLLGTMHLLGRNATLDLFAPPELKEMIELQLKVAKTKFQFELNFH